MTNSELRKKHESLKAVIQKSIEQFEKETGETVDDISINRIDITAVGNARQHFLKTIQIRLVEDAEWSA